MRRGTAAQELADDAGRFHKRALKQADRARQGQDEAAGRLRLVTVLPMFEEELADWLLLDFDMLQAPPGVEWRADLAWTAAYARMQLPGEFHGYRCVYYATGSAADLTKPDVSIPFLP